jgi:hypothetical protein
MPKAPGKSNGEYIGRRAAMSPLASGLNDEKEIRAAKAV